VKQFTSGESKYISLNIEPLVKNEANQTWSKPKSIVNDVILSKANIDYSRKIDAIFHLDNPGELFFIQGIDTKEKYQKYSQISFN